MKNETKTTSSEVELAQAAIRIIQTTRFCQSRAEILDHLGALEELAAAAIQKA